jgi:hypothetical protein
MRGGSLIDGIVNRGTAVFVCSPLAMDFSVLHCASDIGLQYWRTGPVVHVL